MFLNKDSILINGVSMGTYLTSVSFQYPKLWSDDTGRSLSGRFNGVLRGVFPKFELNFRPLNQSELETLVPIFDSEYQTFTYYDPFKKTNVSTTTYAGDWDFSMDGVYKTKAFKIAFVSVDKRV